MFKATIIKVKAYSQIQFNELADWAAQRARLHTEKDTNPLEKTIENPIIFVPKTFEETTEQYFGKGEFSNLKKFTQCANNDQKQVLGNAIELVRTTLTDKLNKVRREK
eukprot:NODE_552_length_6155_cov_0.827774.p7 type:complete len:108 gc:universal NODE_552_length_6155_cov_0.827774:1098-775(-)